MNETVNNPTPSASKKRGGAARREFIRECRDVRITQTIRLSHNTRWILKRHLDGLSRASYLIRFYCRVGAGSEAEDQIIGTIEATIKAAEEEIEKRISIADQMLARQAIKYNLGQFTEVTVYIIDPLAFRFLRVLEKANELDQKLNALWLATVLDNAQKKQACEDIEGNLKHVHRQARSLFDGLRTRFYEQRDNRRAELQQRPEPPSVELAEQAPLVADRQAIELVVNEEAA